MNTDTKLQDQVLSELRWAHLDDPSDVRVEVQDGHVTLSGEVPSEDARSAAEWAARRVRGVTGVDCEILVIEPASRILQ
jgi:osmotically-inducible protein OsmY